MSKKIIFFIFIAFLAILPAAHIKAAQYFIGVTIASASAPGYASSGTVPTDNHWCLPSLQGGSPTQLYIRNSSGSNLTAVSPTSNPVSLTSPACAGDTVWSALFDLTSGQTYQIYFDLPNSYYVSCPGFLYYNNNYSCAVTAGENLDCCETCAYYGLQEASTTTGCTSSSTSCRIVSYRYNDDYCFLESFLMGKECNSCTAGASFGYYNEATQDCYTPYTISYNGGYNYGYSSCAAPGSDLTRVCVCNVSSINNYYSSFTYNFTTDF